MQPPLLGSTLEQAVHEAHRIIDDAKDRYRHVATIALFSGGNDSTALLHLCRDRVDFALHINTGIGIDVTREFVRDTAEVFSVRLDERKTDPAWYRDDIIKHGFPGPMQHRVMYHNLKRERLREVKRELQHKRGDRIMLLTGERAYESQRRMGYGNTTMRLDDGCIWVNPIHFFTDWHMYEYRKAHRLPRNPVSDALHRSGECLCGAMAQRSELAEIETWYPHVADEIHALERMVAEAGHGKRARWAWGSEDRRKAPTPGPMCHSCHLFPDLAEEPS